MNKLFKCLKISALIFEALFLNFSVRLEKEAEENKRKKLEKKSESVSTKKQLTKATDSKITKKIPEKISEKISEKIPETETYSASDFIQDPSLILDKTKEGIYKLLNNSKQIFTSEDGNWVWDGYKWITNKTETYYDKVMRNINNIKNKRRKLYEN